VARIVNGKIALRTGPVDYRDIIHAGVNAVRPLMDSRQQRLDVELPSLPLAMTADAIRIAQSLQNLLSNASRYMPEGGGIRVAVRVEGTACVTEVRDTGHGIAAEALERIFWPFEQEGAPHGHGESGLGIGLPLARKLVELHGGMLCAASPEPGQGTTFALLLPLAAHAGHPSPPHVPAEDGGPAAGSCVLVVDDNRDSADSMVSLLELLGHEARAVYGALDFQPRVVLLDLSMPDGFSVLQRLREGTVAPMFVVAMTGYGQDTDRRRAWQAGFQAQLTKPVGIEDLQRVLRTLPSCSASREAPSVLDCMDLGFGRKEGWRQHLPRGQHHVLDTRGARIAQSKPVRCPVVSGQRFAAVDGQDAAVPRVRQGLDAQPRHRRWRMDSTEDCGEGGVSCIPPGAQAHEAHRNAGARRVKDVPAVAEVDLDIGVEVARPEPRVGAVVDARCKPCREVERPAQRDHQVREVTAHPHPVFERVQGGGA
jgi:CheY-like chemotaxis protein